MKYGIKGYVSRSTTNEEFVKGVTMMTESLLRKMEYANDVPILSTFKLECKLDGGELFLIEATVEAKIVEPLKFMQSDAFIDAVRGKDYGSV